MARRAEATARGDRHCVTGSAEDPILAPVRRWQDEVHRPGIYDLEVDHVCCHTRKCAAAIDSQLRSGPPGGGVARIARGISWAAMASRTNPSCSSSLGAHDAPTSWCPFY